MGYDLQMERAERMGVGINERVEQTFVGDYASLTTADNTLLGGSAGDIALTVTNVDDVKNKEAQRLKRRSYIAGGRQSTIFAGIQSRLDQRLQTLKQRLGE